MLDIEMDKRTSGEQAADALRHEILSGRIADGCEIIQAELAQSLGLSRMPVRESLRQLEGEGFIERLDNRHTRVIGITTATLSSRFALLAEMTKLALMLLDDRGLAELEKLLQTAPDSRRAHMAFHASLFALCPDRFLSQLYQRVFSGFWGFCVERAKDRLNGGELCACIEAARGEKADIGRAVERYYRRIEKTLSEDMK